MKRSLALLILPLLGACVSTPEPSSSTTRTTTTNSTAQRPPMPAATTPPPRRIPPPSTTGFRPPRILNVPGLESVIGQNADGLTRQFGPARLDVFEGDVRKLQFMSPACVLDVYLYPLSPGADPTATYVDARRASDGLDVDRASCVAVLKRP